MCIRDSLFYPDQGVTRGEFAVMLVNAAKLSGSVAPCVNTGLLDDSDICLLYTSRCV